MKSSTEHDEQVALFQWAKLNEKKYPQLKWMHASAAGGKRNIITAMKLKKSGVKAGVPDIFLPEWMNHSCGIYHGLFIEMKRLNPRGKTSPEQQEWIKALAEKGYVVHVCWGWEAAKIVIVDYLEGNIS